MATTQAPRVVSRRRAAVKAAPPPRHTNRFRRYWKHPVNSFWGLFSSVKTAIVLIALIALVCIIGIIVIQAPQEISSSPSDFSLWIASDMVGKYGQTWTTIFSALGFFNIFDTWYFKILLVLLAINVTICTLNRAPGIWYNFRNPAVRTNDRFYQNALARQELDTGQDVAGIRRFFRKRYYQVKVKEGNGNGATYLYAYKNTWATLSTFVFHACLVALMLAPLLTIWRGFGTNSMAEHILPAPVYNYLQSLAGFSYTQPLPDGESGVVYPIGTANNIEYRSDQFVATFNSTGEPTDFYTDLSIFQDGKQVAQQRIRVNSPLTYGGVTFHQASFILYAWITITDAKGNVIFNQKPVLNESLNDINPNTGNSVPVSVAENIPIPNIGQDMNIAATQTPDGWAVIVNGSDQSGNPTFCGIAGAGHSAPMIDLSQSNLSCEKAFAALNLGQIVKLKGWTLNVKLVKEGTVLLITKDSGSTLIWPISALLILSLCVTFYFPQRRVWIRYRDGHVQFAGLKEHFINVQRDFNTLARDLLALDAKAGRTVTRELLRDPPAASAPEKASPKPKPAKSGKRSAALSAKAEAAEEIEATPDSAATAAIEADAPEMTDTAEAASESREAETAAEKDHVTAGD